MSILYVPFMMAMMLGFASFAVDWGRVQLAKTQMLHAADAGARAGALRLSSGTNDDAVTAAITISGANTADGSSVSLQQSDVEIGNWDSATRSFTPVSGNASANAVRVTAHRLANRGNGVPLALAGIFGRGSCDVSVQAIAVSAPGPSYGIIGLNSISMSGSSNDSYISTTGAFSSNAFVATNGQLSMSGSTDIKGNAYYGTLKTSGSAKITGTSAVIHTTLAYPNGNAGSFANVNNDADIPSND